MQYYLSLSYQCLIRNLRNILIVVGAFALSLPISACSPSISSSDPQERIEAITQQKNIDQATLLRIAKTDEDVGVRCAAIGHLTDQEELKSILINEPPGLGHVRDKVVTYYLELWIERGEAKPKVLKDFKEGKPIMLDGSRQLNIEIGYSHDVSKINTAALQRITDPKVLQAALDDGHFWKNWIKSDTEKRLAELRTHLRTP